MQTRKTFDCPSVAAAHDCEGCPVFRECIADFQKWAAEQDAARIMARAVA